MNAAILHDFKKPLSIEEVERPHPEADEVFDPGGSLWCLPFRLARG
jgi:hypothetical protein